MLSKNNCSSFIFCEIHLLEKAIVPIGDPRISTPRFSSSRLPFQTGGVSSGAFGGSNSAIPGGASWKLWLYASVLPLLTDMPVWAAIEVDTISYTIRARSLDVKICTSSR